MGSVRFPPKDSQRYTLAGNNSLFIWGLVTGHHKPHIDPVKPMFPTVAWIAAKDVPTQRCIITGCLQLIVTIYFIDVCTNCLGKKLSDLAQSGRIQLKVWVHSTIQSSPSNGPTSMNLNLAFARLILPSLHKELVDLLCPPSSSRRYRVSISGSLLMLLSM